MRSVPLPDDKVLFYLRFDKRMWLEKVIDGELSFSCPGKHIEEARRTGNNEQGDLLEGVFARLHRSRPKIHEMKTVLGKDLEIIDDGEFVFLRRKSAKNIPIFCMYGLTVGDVNCNNNISGAGRYDVYHCSDEKIRDGFFQFDDINDPDVKKRPAWLLLKENSFSQKVCSAAYSKNLQVYTGSVKYVDMTKEFFITPTMDYPELMVKAERYAHQLEYRLRVPSIHLGNFYERYNFSIEGFGDEVGEKEVYMEDYGYGIQVCFSLEFDENGKVIGV